MKNFAICLWFDSQAEEAARFYTTVFKNSKTGPVAHYDATGAAVSGQKEGSVLTVSLELENLHVEALNGGPIFKFTPGLSFFVSCSSEEEINTLWKKLSDGGSARMGLEKYPWAEKYGWTADRFGVEWQLILAPNSQKIRPAFLFVDELFGKGEEALQLYTSLFPHSKIDTIARDESTKGIQHCEFTLNGQSFVLMEGPGKHGWKFTNATSIMVFCDTQKEIDHYWDVLSEGGTIEECGWLKDKFGVSWQIVPRVMHTYLADPKVAEKVMKAMFQMKKLDIAALTAAAK